MSAHILTAVPSQIRAGDSVVMLLSLADYPASEGWSLEFVLVNGSGKITFRSEADGDSHSVEVHAADSAEWSSGKYFFICSAVNGLLKNTASSGYIEILPDLSAVDTLDARSHAQKTLDALEAWIEGRNLAVAEYEIAGRKMKYIPIAELLKLRDAYRREVRGQTGKSGRIYVRF